MKHLNSVVHVAYSGAYRSLCYDYYYMDVEVTALFIVLQGSGVANYRSAEVSSRAKRMLSLL